MLPGHFSRHFGSLSAAADSPLWSQLLSSAIPEEYSHLQRVPASDVGWTDVPSHCTAWQLVQLQRVLRVMLVGSSLLRCYYLGGAGGAAEEVPVIGTCFVHVTRCLLALQQVGRRDATTTAAAAAAGGGARGVEVDVSYYLTIPDDISTRTGTSIRHQAQIGTGPTHYSLRRYLQSATQMIASNLLMGLQGLLAQEDAVITSQHHEVLVEVLHCAEAMPVQSHLALTGRSLREQLIRMEQRGSKMQPIRSQHLQTRIML